MIGRHPALPIVFIFYCCIITSDVAAQPVLPDIAGAGNNNEITLTWNCPYSDVKAIEVMRSNDSVNYSAIDKMKRPGKGVQSYSDQRPASGNNYYKLVVIFSSGLHWSSNHCMVYISPKAQTGFTPVVTNSFPLPPGDGNATGAIAAAAGAKDSAFTRVQYTQSAAVFKNVSVAQMPSTEATPISGTERSRQEVQEPPSPPEKKITLPPFKEEQGDPSLSVSPRFIAVAKGTGDININLPDDIATHHYSLSVYDDKSELVTEVPRINVATMIMDKRNFQRRGLYKFVIRTDVVELETGYIEVIPD